MKKYSKKEKLVILVRILTAALIAALLWTVIYFLAPVKASAATSYTAFEPSSSNLSNDTLTYSFNVSRDSLQNQYYFLDINNQL